MKKLWLALVGVGVLLGAVIVVPIWFLVRLAKAPRGG